MSAENRKITSIEDAIFSAGLDKLSEEYLLLSNNVKDTFDKIEESRQKLIDETSKLADATIKEKNEIQTSFKENMLGIKNDITTVRSSFLENLDNIKIHLDNLLVEHLKIIKQSVESSKKELQINSQKTPLESKLFLTALIIIVVTNLLIAFQLTTVVKKVNDLELNQINLIEKNKQKK